ncbi:MAG: hypothetical protein KBA26_13190, partial [Candidatus Delongbacteria bacterium]|nr:hypothetical protein [Candidatus Delongbacteria bacterium]
LVQIILESDSIPPVETGLRIAEAFQRPDHFFNHIHYYKNDHQTAFAVRLYHLTSNLETARRYLDEPMYYDLIVHYHHDLLHQGRAILNEKPILWVSDRIPVRAINALRKIYREFENFLIFN